MDYCYENLKLKKTWCKYGLEEKNILASSQFNKYKVYSSHGIYYSENHIIKKKCLLVNTGFNKECYIDTNFSAYHDIILFKIPSSNCSDKYLLSIIKLFMSLMGDSYFYNNDYLFIPLFGEHLIDLIEKFKSKLVLVVDATIKLKKIEEKRLALINDISLI